MMESLGDNPIVGAREEPRLTEQQFGNFQKAEEMERFKENRHQFGRFYYRFPDGESGLDVYNRVTSFIGTLFRLWGRAGDEINDDVTVILITHGLTLRLFLMRWFRLTVQEFEESRNPTNGCIIRMERLTESIPSISDIKEKNSVIKKSVSASSIEYTLHSAAKRDHDETEEFSIEHKNIQLSSIVHDDSLPALESSPKLKSTFSHAWNKVGHVNNKKMNVCNI